MQSRTILITAFRPFDGRTINGAQTIAQSLQGESISGLDVQVCLLRVCWRSVEVFANQTLAAVQHPLVLALGEADRTQVCVETRAHGVCEGEDVLGQPPPRSDADLPSVASRLDFSTDWFADHRVSVVSSSNAGNYLCNRLLYLGLQHYSGRFGFVHLPVQGDIANSDYIDLYRPAVVSVASHNVVS